MRKKKEEEFYFLKEQLKVLDERIKKYERGKMKFVPYEEAMKKLCKKFGLKRKNIPK